MDRESRSKDFPVDGQVKFWIAEKAWGLIRDSETNREFHVHINDVVGRIALERNAWVSFDISPRKGKGQSATNVTLIACPPRYLLRGTIIRFIEDKGFGFIKDMQSQQSLFVHANNLTVPIKENDKVSFEIEMGQRGPMAVNVKIVN